jgi:hypothetical protein
MAVKKVERLKRESRTWEVESRKLNRQLASRGALPPSAPEMKQFQKASCVILLSMGLTLLVFGMSRYNLPYEDGRYFDPRTETVYHLQTAEFLTLAGATLSLGGLLLAFASFLGSRRIRSSPAGSSSP